VDPVYRGLCVVFTEPFALRLSILPDQNGREWGEGFILGQEWQLMFKQEDLRLNGHTMYDPLCVTCDCPDEQVDATVNTADVVSK